MKDKLSKTGHKKAYYRLKRTMRLSLFALALGLTTAAPVLITYGVEVAKAESQKVETPDSDSPVVGVEKESILSYSL